MTPFCPAAFCRRTELQSIVGTPTDRCRPSQTVTDRYRPSQTATDPYRPLQTVTNRHSVTDMNRPLQTTTDRFVFFCLVLVVFWRLFEYVLEFCSSRNGNNDGSKHSTHSNISIQQIEELVVSLAPLGLSGYQPASLASTPLSLAKPSDSRLTTNSRLGRMAQLYNSGDDLFAEGA